MSDTLGKVIPTAETIRENELRKIQGFLRSNGLIFSFSHHYLYHKSNVRDIEADAQRAVDLLGQTGFCMRVMPGVFECKTFALKSPDGLVLQKLQDALRIFFRAKR
jgi:hypothetical protein